MLGAECGGTANITCIYCCIVAPYVFILYMMFHLINVGERLSLRDINVVSYDMCTYDALHNAL